MKKIISQRNICITILAGIVGLWIYTAHLCGLF